MNQQLQLVHTYQPRRTTSVPTLCPFAVGQTVRNTRLNRTGQVLEQRADPLHPGSWWVRVQLDDAGTTSWWAPLCEVA